MHPEAHAPAPRAAPAHCRRLARSLRDSGRLPIRVSRAHPPGYTPEKRGHARDVTERQAPTVTSQASDPLSPLISPALAPPCVPTQGRGVAMKGGRDLKPAPGGAGEAGSDGMAGERRSLARRGWPW